MLYQLCEEQKMWTIHDHLEMFLQPCRIDIVHQIQSMISDSHSKCSKKFLLKDSEIARILSCSPAA